MILRNDKGYLWLPLVLTCTYSRLKLGESGGDSVDCVLVEVTGEVELATMEGYFNELKLVGFESVVSFF